MPRATKKSRCHKKPELGPSSANINMTAGDKKIADASVKLGSHVGQAGPLMHLPVDVFLEIAAYCCPYDLLSLSRVSTKLRAVVLAKRNRGIWVCARNNLDLPMLACPNDLSEPRYASLVFDPFCTVCGARDTPQLRLDYATYARLCEQCWKTNVKPGRTILRELEPEFRRDRSLKRVIFDLMPAISSPHKILDPPDVLHQEPYLTFYQPEVMAVAREYQAVVQSSGGDLRAEGEYIELRRARTRKRLKFHAAMAHWACEYERARQAAMLQSLIDTIDAMIRNLDEKAPRD